MCIPSGAGYKVALRRAHHWRKAERARAISASLAAIRSRVEGRKPFLMGHFLGGTLAAIYAAATAGTDHHGFDSDQQLRVSRAIILLIPKAASHAVSEPNRRGPTTRQGAAQVQGASSGRSCAAYVEVCLSLRKSQGFLTLRSICCWSARSGCQASRSLLWAP